MAAGLGGRRADSLLMRMTDVAYAFPDLLMIILLVSIIGILLLPLVFLGRNKGTLTVTYTYVGEIPPS